MIDKKMEAIYDMIPKDSMYGKRINNLERAVHILFNRKGLVFVNKRFGFLNNMTWITARQHRNKGVATTLAKLLIRKYIYMTAKTQNEISRRVARKAGFRELVRNYWLYINFNLIMRRI